MQKRCWGLCLFITIVLSLSIARSSAFAIVFASRQEAIKQALPDADRIDSRTITLTDEQRKKVSTLATVPVETKLVSLYTGYKEAAIVGYAFLDTRIIRTLPGTFLITLSPAGEVRKIMVVAFHEPDDYRPSERWLQQFSQQTLTSDLQVYKGIHAIGGATLSSQAVTNAVRQALALFQVLVQEGQ